MLFNYSGFLIKSILFLLLCTKLFTQSNDPNTVLLENSGCADKYPGSDILLIYDSTSVDVMESGLSYVTMHKLTKALTANGAKNLRQVNFSYDPLSAAVEVKFVRIYRKNGDIEVIGKEKIFDYPAPARMIYWGGREVSVEIGRIEPGDAVETVVFRKGFTYALLRNDDDSRFVPPMKGHFYDIVNFYSTVPVLEKVYLMALPEDKDLQYEVYNGEVGSYVHFAPTQNKKINVRINPHKKEHKQKEEADNFRYVPGKKLYCWFKKNIMPFKGEPNMVAYQDVAPKLLLSTSPDWYAKAVWFHKVNEDFGSFDVTPDVQAKTDELIKGLEKEMDKISVLTHWVAEEVRYSGISMGEGEGYTLHKGEMTFSDRCGVCKDKAGMLVTMLRAAGIESYPAMTMAGSRIDRIPADQFNHSVTLAKLSNGDWILLDPTWVPGVRELWSSAEQQQQYLMGIPGGADLKTTPVSPPENHYLRIKGKSKLKSDGMLEGSITITADGQSDSRIRRLFNRSYKSGAGNYFPEKFSSISADAEVWDIKYTDPVDISSPIVIELKYRIPDYATITNDKIVFTPLLAYNPLRDNYFSGEILMDTSLSEREYGFRTSCSKLIEISESVELPKYKEVSEKPEKVDVEGTSASYEADYNIKGRRLNFNSSHVLQKRIYEREDWPEFREALIKRLEIMDTELVFLK